MGNGTKMQPLEKKKMMKIIHLLFYIILPLLGSYCDASPIVSLATSLTERAKENLKAWHFFYQNRNLLLAPSPSDLPLLGYFLTYHVQPWGVSSNAASNISNGYQYGEGGGS